MKYGITRRPERFLDSFFDDDFFTGFSYGKNVDIYQEDGNYVVEVDLPGFKKEEINLEFKGDILTITANKTEREEKEERNYLYRSRRCQSFTRQIRFSEIDKDNVAANFEDGILMVNLPVLKHEETTNKIEVK